MDEHQHDVTASVSDRTPRPLMGPVLSFDLFAEADELAREAGFSEHGHNARTLIKHSEFRLVLIVMAAQQRIVEQTVDERICVQTLSGRLDVRAAGEPRELGRGGLMAIDRGQPFEIEARERSTVLLWIGWSR